MACYVLVLHATPYRTWKEGGGGLLGTVGYCRMGKLGIVASKHQAAQTMQMNAGSTTLSLPLPLTPDQCLSLMH